MVGNRVSSKVLERGISSDFKGINEGMLRNWIGTREEGRKECRYISNL